MRGRRAAPSSGPGTPPPARIITGRPGHASPRMGGMAPHRRAPAGPGSPGGPADDHVGGPDATVRATARALARIDDAATLVLVEGVLDQIALETAAAERGRDLDADRIVIVPIGGAHA